MTAAAARVGHPDAARRVARAALDIARQARQARFGGSAAGGNQ
jgi:UDP-N-acetylglucosamine--N-acetylmuramyl-(pentapeptide) pyrophosphoryl-undecaprenol N-acetylglucosamine transferase